MNKKKNEPTVKVIGDINSIWHNINIIRQKMFEIEFEKLSPKQQKYVVNEMRQKGMLQEMKIESN